VERISAHRQPDDIVRIGGVAGATGVLLVTDGVDDDGVVEGSYRSPTSISRFRLACKDWTLLVIPPQNSHRAMPSRALVSQ